MLAHSSGKAKALTEQMQGPSQQHVSAKLCGGRIVRDGGMEMVTGKYFVYKNVLGEEGKQNKIHPYFDDCKFSPHRCEKDHYSAVNRSTHASVWTHLLYV